MRKHLALTAVALLLAPAASRGDGPIERAALRAVPQEQPAEVQPEA